MDYISAKSELRSKPPKVNLRFILAEATALVVVAGLFIQVI